MALHDLSHPRDGLRLLFLLVTGRNFVSAQVDQMADVSAEALSEVRKRFLPVTSLTPNVELKAADDVSSVFVDPALGFGEADAMTCVCPVLWILVSGHAAASDAGAAGYRMPAHVPIPAWWWLGTMLVGHTRR